MVAGTSDDRRRTTVRLTALTAVITAAFVALGVSFWYIQVIQNAIYREMAETNHQRRLSLRAPRGVLFDRKQRLMVENRDAYTISILREHSGDLERHRVHAGRRHRRRREVHPGHGLPAPQ